MSILLALASLTALPAVPAASPAPSDVPIRLWISSNRTFKPGDAVRVQVETERSGYLLVLHFDPRGRVSVLFPVAPGDETQVEAGRRYEIRGSESAASFVAEGSGPGLVYAALAEDPWQYGAAVMGGAWDYTVLTIPTDTEDPEADLTELVQRMASPRGFDYDALDYAVLGYRGERVSRPSWWSPTWDDVTDDWYGWDCFACSHYGPSTIYIGFGWPHGYPGWNWWYYPYRYRYYYGYSRPWYWGYPYYPYYPSYGGGGVVVRRPYGVITGRPRGYTVDRWRPRGSTTTGFDRAPASRDRGEAVAPRGPARRARGDRPTTTRPWTRDDSPGGTVNRPSSPSNDRGARGSDRSGGDRGSARPRGGDRGTRARGGRSEVQAQVSAPTIEHVRPEGRPRSGWVRVPEDPPASSGEGRRVERSQPVRIEAPPARRSTPVERVSRARGGSAGRGEVSRPAAGSGSPSFRAPAVSRGGPDRSAPRAAAPAPRNAPSPRASAPAPRSQGGEARSGGGGRARGRP